MTSIQKQLDRVQLTDTKIQLVMPERILNQVKYLCRNIAKVEWSGVLFYSVKGSIQDPENLVLTIEDILPMNKGTAAYTEYSFDERVIDYMMDNETMEKGWKMGHIHSHNTMAVFFSNTDWSELNDNAPNHNFYLSLIVNNFMDFCAKVCFIAESDSAKTFDFYAKNEDGEKYIFKSEEYEVKEKKLIVYDCAIDSPKNEITVEESFCSKVSVIINKAEEEEKAQALALSQRAINMSNIPSNTTRIFPDTKRNINKEWGWDQESFVGKSEASLTEARTIKDLTGDELESEIEEFAIYIMGTGSHGYTDMEDALAHSCRLGLTSEELTKEVVTNYSAYYDSYFDDMEDKDVVKNFLTLTELAVEEIELEESYSRFTAHKIMLKAVAGGLTQLVANFKKYGTE